MWLCVICRYTDVDITWPQRVQWVLILRFTIVKVPEVNSQGTAARLKMLDDIRYGPFKHWTSDRRADHVYIGSVGPWPNLDICSTSKLGPLFGPSNCDLTWTSYWRSTFDQHLVIVLDVIWTSMKGAGNLHYNYLQISTLLLSTWLIYDYRLFLNRHDWLCVCLFIYVGHVFWFCVIFMTAHREFAKESTHVHIPEIVTQDTNQNLMVNSSKATSTFLKCFLFKATAHPLIAFYTETFITMKPIMFLLKPMWKHLPHMVLYG